MAEYNFAEIQDLVVQLENQCRIRGYRGVLYLHSDPGQPIIHKLIGPGDGTNKDGSLIKQRVVVITESEADQKGDDRDTASGSKDGTEDNKGAAATADLLKIDVGELLEKHAKTLGRIYKTIDDFHKMHLARIEEGKKLQKDRYDHVKRAYSSCDREKNIYYLFVTDTTKFFEVLDRWNGDNKEKLSDMCKPHVLWDKLDALEKANKITTFSPRDIPETK